MNEMKATVERLVAQAVEQGHGRHVDDLAVFRKVAALIGFAPAKEVVRDDRAA